MKEASLAIFIVAFIVAIFVNLGAMLYRTMYEGRLIENCSNNKEILVGRVVIKCEIVKDLR